MNRLGDHPRPWVVLVGGFLGAGKTTLILAAAKELNSRGLRCALITNDQGDALVDTRMHRGTVSHTAKSLKAAFTADCPSS